MKIPKQTRNIAIVLVALATIFAAYTFFLRGDDVPEDVLLSASENDAGAAGADFVALLYQLKSLHLDLTLFDDPVFKSMENFGTEIPPEPIGKPNPFIPLSEGSFVKKR